jgi:serine/threonine-protein kinase RsbW
MDAHAGELQLELPARSASVTRARHAAEKLASAVGASRANVALAVSEAVTNAIQHAYPEAEGRVFVHGHEADGRLVVEVVDHGVGMRPNPNSPGLGFGLPLIGQVADEVRIDAGPTGTTVQISFATS